MLLVLLILAGLVGAAVLLGLFGDRAVRALGAGVLLLAIVEILART